ncbi:hypothetical protein, partial [Cellulomonas bogoriensis]|uniref:hypothetical protein n=1 Tax=Cellulomonas bogoriensis TaxID=301388 RepID=UPI000557F269
VDVLGPRTVRRAETPEPGPAVLVDEDPPVRVLLRSTRASGEAVTAAVAGAVAARSARRERGVRVQVDPADVL